MSMTARPHDLLWGMTPDHLDADAPAWAADVLRAGQPVVVRRAPPQAGLIPVGIRGTSRDRRHAGWLPASAVCRQLCPEQLPALLGESDAFEALCALAQIAPVLDRLGLPWGVTGGVGYQLATGVPVLHGGSDLDLLLRAPQPLDRQQAARLLARLELLPCRVDLQLETPAGAVALREWASAAPRVLLKAGDGPRLITDPWWKEAA